MLNSRIILLAFLHDNNDCNVYNIEKRIILIEFPCRVKYTENLRQTPTVTLELFIEEGCSPEQSVRGGVLLYILSLWKGGNKGYLSGFCSKNTHFLVVTCKMNFPFSTSYVQFFPVFCDSKVAFSSFQPNIFYSYPQIFCGFSISFFSAFLAFHHKYYPSSLLFTMEVPEC